MSDYILNGICAQLPSINKITIFLNNNFYITQFNLYIDLFNFYLKVLEELAYLSFIIFFDLIFDQWFMFIYETRIRTKILIIIIIIIGIIVLNKIASTLIHGCSDDDIYGIEKSEKKIDLAGLDQSFINASPNFPGNNNNNFNLIFINLFNIFFKLNNKKDNFFLDKLELNNVLFYFGIFFSNPC
jgi:hypothetical protein